jgi:hypothetical protein
MLYAFLDRTARLVAPDRTSLERIHKDIQEVMRDPHSLLNVVLSMAGPNFRVLDWMLSFLGGGAALDSTGWNAG